MTGTGQIDRLLGIMAALRDKDCGCPWDIEQTFATIAPYTIEEAYEVADAIARDDLPDLKDELGDLLLQVVFHARMAEELGEFDFDAVAGTISDKMIRRHPHVFSSGDADTPDAVKTSWETIKAAERAEKRSSDTPTSALDGVAMALPALTRAEKLSKRAARVGFEWPAISMVFDDIREELDELEAEIGETSDPDRLEDEMGDLLFCIANLARTLKVDPEAALRRTNAKFTRRFHFVEERVAATGGAVEEADLEVLDRYWDQAKDAERQNR
ncbi:MAG: nucleoside triphosphate pyrophosphohydrolase [Alphaproteobacteria bacterium]